MSSSSSNRKTRRQNTNKQAITAFIRRFNRSKSFRDQVIAKAHEFGAFYFAGHRSGYVGGGVDELAEPLRTYTKAEFIETYEETSGDYDEDLLQTSFSDAFRHAFVVDMSNKKHPRFLPVTDDRFEGMVDDYIFTWDGVKQLAKDHPTMFVVSVFTEGMFSLHIPIA
jgi:hypothetical protein